MTGGNVDIEPHALVVLGASPAVMERRADAAVKQVTKSQSRRPPTVVVVSGGRLWPSGDGTQVTTQVAVAVAEADFLMAALVERGVPRESILRELLSFTTAGNARFTARLLRRVGLWEVTRGRVVLVTCPWHEARSRAAFEGEGFTVLEGAPSPAPVPVRLRAREQVGRQVLRVQQGLRRRGLSLLLATLGLCALGTTGCHRPNGGASSTAPATTSSTAGPDGAEARLLALAKAEDGRRWEGSSGEGVPSLGDGDPRVRRRAAQALARIADATVVAPLLRLLGDEDEGTVAWAAYGLGATCRGREDAHVRALTARAASLPARTGLPTQGNEAEGLDPRWVLPRAVGRCGGPLAEATLASWIRGGFGGEASALALGDMAGRKVVLAEGTLATLLDLADGAAGSAGAGGSARGAVGLYAFGRMDRVPEAFAARVLKAAQGALSRPGPERVFAVRALGRMGTGAGNAALPELLHLLQTRSAGAAERAEAARALSKFGEGGKEAAAQALAYLVPDKDPRALAALAVGSPIGATGRGSDGDGDGDEVNILALLAGVLAEGAPAKAEAILYTLASLAAPTGGAAPSAGLRRRLGVLRCTAAVALVKGAYDAEVLASCDAPGSHALEQARLTTLVRRPLVGDRRKAWLTLATKGPLRVREAALEAVETHAELGESGRIALAEALASPVAGLVATAAEVLHHHPERVLVPTADARRAGSDPSSPPPTVVAEGAVTSAEEVDPRVRKALESALSRPWPEDRVEARMALMDAAASLHLPRAREVAQAACRDPNVTVRERALKALRLVDGSQAPATCPPEGTPTPRPREPSDTALTRTVTLTLVLDSGTLSLALDPTLAPVTTARIAALARSGFYTGQVVHRVVPGFVVQFGDPDGDGYGGSGQLLRCETSPVPFGPLNVGMALAGRDTGSSQVFVTLARTPHLDGEYAHIGHAQGDWAAVLEGDVLQKVTVTD